MKKMLYSTMLVTALMSAYSMNARYDDALIAKGVLTPRPYFESMSTQESLANLHSKVSELYDLVSDKGNDISPTQFNGVKMAHSAVKRTQVVLQEKVDPRHRKSAEADKEIYLSSATIGEKAAVKARNMARITKQAVEKAPVSSSQELKDSVVRSTAAVEKAIYELKSKRGDA